MGTDHPPRDEQAHLANRFGLPNLPTTSTRYLRMPFERVNLHFGIANTPKRFTRCLRRIPRLRGHLVQLSELIRKNVVHAR